MTERLARVRAALDSEGLDALYVSGPVDDIWHANQANRRWLTGFVGSAGRAIVTAEDAVVVLDGRYAKAGASAVRPRGFQVHEVRGGVKQWLPGLVAESSLAGKRVGVSERDTSLSEWTALQEAAAALPRRERPQFVPVKDLLEKLRARKYPDELAALQRAIDAGDAAFESVAARLEPGMTERQIAEGVELAVRAAGGDGISFPTIVAAGPNGALPHAVPTRNVVSPGMPVTIDMGAILDGYNSDLTRTFVVGGEGDAKFHEVYQVVFEAQRTAIDGVEAGMPGTTAHALAASVIEKAGYADQFVHGLGHGVGLEVHEAPYLGPFSEDTLEDGMVFTIEPGIYIPGWGGVRIEDVVVLENGRARQLSHATKLTLAGV